MRLSLLRFLLVLICVSPIEAYAADIRADFVGALFLPSESASSRAWEATYDDPLVNNGRNASWMAFKVVSNGNEAVAVVGISDKGFHIESFAMLPPEKPMSMMDQVLNNRVREYVWSPYGEKLVYAVETYKNSCEVRIFTPSKDMNKNNPILLKWKEDENEQLRSSFCLKGEKETDLFYRSGGRNVQSPWLCRLAFDHVGGLYHDFPIIKGRIYDPVYVAMGQKLVYYRFDGKAPGLYEYYLNKKQKRDFPVLNIPGSDEKKPQYNLECGTVAFASNHQIGDDKTTRVKDEWKHEYRLFAVRLNELERIKAEKAEPRGQASLKGFENDMAAHLVSSETLRLRYHGNFPAREKNTFKWHDDTLFFLLRGVELQASIGIWKCNQSDEAYVYDFGKAGEMKGDFRFREEETKFYYKIDAIKRINNFDVFTSGGCDYLVVSASVSMVTPLTEKEKRRYDRDPHRARAMRPDTYKSWGAESIILLFRLSS